MEELEDDFVVFANNNLEDSTSGEFQGTETVGLRCSNLRLESSVVEGDEEKGEFSGEDAPSRVTTENEPPRPSSNLKRLASLRC